MSRTAALVPAAGRGERLGPGAPKALRDIGGVPILVHAVKALCSAPSVDVVVVAAPADAVEQTRALLSNVAGTTDVEVVSGGETRAESVARALIALPDDIDVVLVHDAARPLIPVELVTNVVNAVRAGNRAVVPGLAVVDTIKRVDDAGIVQETVPRAELRAIQTPQGFDRTLLQMAHAGVDPDSLHVTDDAGLVEALGIEVLVIPGHEDAFKVTTPSDIVFAEAILARRRASGAVN
jgi:2-C-methyl-D-erythritol 4-phosphate cytidylyltransferase